MRSRADDRRRHRRRALLPGRSARDGQPQGLAHEPVGPRRQGREAARLPAVGGPAGRLRRGLARRLCGRACRRCRALRLSALRRRHRPHAGPDLGLDLRVRRRAAGKNGAPLDRAARRPHSSSPARLATRRSDCSFGATGRWRDAGGFPMPLPRSSKAAISCRSRATRSPMRSCSTRRRRSTYPTDLPAISPSSAARRRSRPTSMSQPCRSRTLHAQRSRPSRHFWRPRSQAATTMRSCLTLAPENLAAFRAAAAAAGVAVKPRSALSRRARARASCTTARRSPLRARPTAIFSAGQRYCAFTASRRCALRSETVARAYEPSCTSANSSSFEVQLAGPPQDDGNGIRPGYFLREIGW